MSFSNVNAKKSCYDEPDQPIERSKVMARDQLSGFKQNLKKGEGLDE